MGQARTDVQQQRIEKGLQIMKWTNVAFFLGMAILAVVAVALYPAIMAWLAH